MKTIQELRAAGFTLTDAEQAFGCTRVESPKIFYYFNRRFVDRPEDVANSLITATDEGGRFSLILAGDYHSVPETTEFPYAILSERERNDVITLYESVRQAQHDLSRRLTNLTAATEPFLSR